MAEFDPEVLKDEVGIRALWQLYKMGQWGLLSDFGVERELVEERLVQFENDNIVNHRLTKPQCRALVRAVPELEGAGVELRLAYALKHQTTALLLVGEGFSDARPGGGVE